MPREMYEFLFVKLFQSALSSQSQADQRGAARKAA